MVLIGPGRIYFGLGGGQNNNGKFLEHGGSSDFPEDFQPVDTGQAEIEQNDMGARTFFGVGEHTPSEEKIQCRLAVGKMDYPVGHRVPFQRPLDHLGVSRVILHQQDDERFFRWFFLSVHPSFLLSQGEAESGPLAGFRFHPDAAPVHLDDALDQGQTDARPFRVGAQALEKTENLLMVSGIDADAVVPNEEDRLFLFNPNPDLHQGFGLIAYEFDGVVDQILHHLQI